MKEKKIVVASTNEGKIREFREMFEPLGYTVYSLKDFPDMEDIEETGTTFAENAVIKAIAVTDKYGIRAVSDDSGLEVEAFGNQPGVNSARWLGHETSYTYKNQVILDRMKGETDRRCRYVCAIALTDPDKEPVVFVDTAECLIADEPAGTNGFGYDPIMYFEPLHKTMAEMTKDEKNAISHRGKAVRRLQEWINENE